MPVSRASVGAVRRRARVVVAHELDLGAQPAHGLHLDGRRGARHHDAARAVRGARAAAATPCAWLPAEAAIDAGLALAASSSAAMAL